MMGRAKDIEKQPLRYTRNERNLKLMNNECGKRKSRKKESNAKYIKI